MSSEDAILRCQVLILEQEFLIDHAGDVGQQPSPFVVCHEEHHHKLSALVWINSPHGDAANEMLFLIKTSPAGISGAAIMHALPLACG
jgi:hypothetical protein